MKIKGNMGKATKFTPQLFPPPTPENIAKYTAGKLWANICSLPKLCLSCLGIFMFVTTYLSRTHSSISFILISFHLNLEIYDIFFTYVKFWIVLSWSTKIFLWICKKCMSITEIVCFFKKKPNNQSSLFKYYPLKPSMMLIFANFFSSFHLKCFSSTSGMYGLTNSPNAKKFPRFVPSSFAFPA